MCTFPAWGVINNLHLIDSDPNGFAIYRYGKPGQLGVRELCALGVEEVMVLSGTAQTQELLYQQECPRLKVVYNVNQTVNVPLTPKFLADFDRWVQEAQVSGKKIAFRCECGCHRTGRLAAYYKMKYQSFNAFDAIIDMLMMGKYMYLFPQLIPQVLDLRDYIDGLACRQKFPFCVPRVPYWAMEPDPDVAVSTPAGTQ